MSFLGMGRAQPTSEQKIAAVEGEMRMMADTYNRYARPSAPGFWTPGQPWGKGEKGGTNSR